MNFIDITPFVIPERVLNFDFSTQMLFRCIERKYTETFINGEIRFGQPKNWIEKEKNGNKGQGDLLEGIFLSAQGNDESKLITRLKNNSYINCIEYNEFKYFRRKSIENLYCLCFYGLNNNSFRNKKIDNKGKAHYYSYVSKEFFESFSEKISKEDYLKMNEEDRPSVIFISNPHEFFKRIKKFFNKVGVKEQDVIISPVDYINKNKIMLSGIPYPRELLLKDKFFEKQSEIRIIINSQSKELLEYMKNHNNTINIGNIDDIAKIYDYYFEDLVIERKNKSTIEFNLPVEEVEKYEDMPLEEMLTILGQAYIGQLPESAKNEREKIIEIMHKQLKKKYKIDVDYSKGCMHILNASDKVWKRIIEYSKPHTKLTNFENDIISLIKNKEYHKALECIENINEDETLKNVCEFYKGKILEEKGNYDEAVTIYDYCIENEIKLPEVLSSRSNCYNRLQKYDLAIRDLEILQDTIGYNPQIYSNKGINLINLNKLDEAIIEFNKSIEMNEYNPEAYYNRSVAYYRKGNYNNAKNDIDKAIKYNPTNNFYKSQYERFYKNS